MNAPHEDVGYYSAQFCALDELLEEAEAHSLEIEVLYSALQAMKDNPSLTPVEAMQQGVGEWVK